MTQNIAEVVKFEEKTETLKTEIPYTDAKGRYIPMSVPTFIIDMLDTINPVYPALFKSALVLDREECERLGYPKDYAQPHTSALFSLMNIPISPKLD